MRLPASLLLLLLAVSVHAADWRDNTYPDTTVITSLPYSLPSNNRVYVLNGNLTSNDGGIVISGEDVDLVKVESLFSQEEGTGFVGFMSAISRFTSEKNGNEQLRIKNIPLEVILVLSVIIPFGILMLLWATLKKK